MPPFSANVLTGTQANAIAKDMKNADFKQLDPAIIASPTAIGPVPAIDTKLVFGDECEYIRGFRDTHIVQYDKRQIDQTLQETVNKGTEQTYLLGRKLEITSFSKLEVTGTRDVHVTAEDVENYDIHREITEPIKYEVSNAKFEHTWMAVDTKGLSIESTLAKIELEGMNAKIGLFESVNEAIAVQLKPLQQKIGVVEDKIGAFAGKVIATYDAMPSPSIIAPFD